MKRYFKLIKHLIVIVALFVIIGIITNSKVNSTTIEKNTNENPSTITTTPILIKTNTSETTPTNITSVKVDDAMLLSEDEINLIALVTMGEAEGEPELGKRLVIDTILNRVDSIGFPDTIADVIYQPNAFECMWNGRLDRCYIVEDICELVREESEQRRNSQVVFFCAYSYSDYGTPLFKVGNHYFSSM